MSWWGKIVGGAFGMMLGGPIGAILGAVVGHNFDKGLANTTNPQFNVDYRERIQTVFYAATFSVMGHLCKSDGQVTQDEIDLANQIMQKMDFNKAQRAAAIKLFNQGKQDHFPFIEVMQQLKQEIGDRANLRRMFIEIQIMAAYADNVIHPLEHEILLTICNILKISQAEFEQLCTMIGNTLTNKPVVSLQQAYVTLGITEAATEAEIKKAYRRLINQHHPDKLVAKGLPEEMMKVAASRTDDIKKAYETIKQAKKF